MKQYITIISLLLFSQVSHADLDYRNICKYLKDTHASTSDEERIYNIISSNPSYKESLESSLRLAVQKFNEMGPDEAEDFCVDELKIISRASEEAQSEAFLKTAGSDKPTEPVPVDSTPATSEQMFSCQSSSIIIDATECRVNTTLELPSDLEAILKLPVIVPKIVIPFGEAKYSKPECDCLEKNIRESYAKQNFANLNTTLSFEKNRINELIFNAAGKKIMNQFAANLEDVNFFRTNNVSAVGNDEASKALMCNNVEELKSLTKSACGQNKVTPEKMKSRIESLLGAFGDFKDVGTLEEKFARLQNEIMNIKLDPKKVDAGKSGHFTRSEYDQLRYGAYKGRPEVKFLNEVTDMILDNEVLGPALQERIRLEKKSPGYAIMDLLKDESNPEVKKALQELVDKHKREPFYVNLGVKLKSAADDLGKYVRDAYELGTDMHPGLKALYKDTELFDKVRRAVINQGHSPKGHDMIGTLESNPEFLKEHFGARCEKFKRHFTEAVCVPDDDFISRTNPEDLNKLLSPFQGQVNQAVKDLLICQIPKAADAGKKSVFARLAFNVGDKLNQSDYWERKSQSGNSRPDRFTAIAKALESGNKEATKYLSHLSRVGREQGSAVPEIASRLSSKPSQLDSIESFSSSQSSVAQQASLSDSTLMGQQNIISQMPNYSAAPPVAPEVKETKPSRDIKDTRSLLREFLANEENKHQVEQHLSQTSEAERAELLSIKNQIETDKLKMQQLMSESEKLKVRNMETKVQTLEQEYDEMAEEAEEFQPQYAATQSSGGTQTMNSGAGIASNASASARASASGRSIASNAISSNAQVRSDRESGPVQKSAQGVLIIDSGKIINGEMKQEQLNQEVMSFVKLSNVDAEMLRQMKETGIVLKFKTLEGGKEVLKEMKVEYAAFTPEIKQFLERQIALKDKERELKAARRAYSFNTLKQILGVRAQQTN